MFHYGHIYNFSPWTLRAVAALAGLKEHDLTKERSGNSTGVFFVVDPSVKPDAIENSAHAENLRALLETHSLRGPETPLGEKLARKLLVRVTEFLNTRGDKSFSDIGSKVADQIIARCAAGPERRI